MQTRPESVVFNDDVNAKSKRCHRPTRRKTTMIKKRVNRKWRVSSIQLINLWTTTKKKTSWEKHSISYSIFKRIYYTYFLINLLYSRKRSRSHFAFSRRLLIVVIHFNFSCAPFWFEDEEAKTKCDRIQSFNNSVCRPLSIALSLSLSLSLILYEFFIFHFSRFPLCYFSPSVFRKMK